MERIGHTSPGAALRYQHVMAHSLAAALDDLAQEAIEKGPRARGGHDPASTQQRGKAGGR